MEPTGGDSQAQKLAFLSPAMGEGEIGRLAHYKVIKVLGEGGMGLVLHAEDTNLQRPVALKVMKSEFESDKSAQTRFLREARAMAQIKSEHVVTVHQVDEHNGVTYIAMEMLEGQPLSDLIKSRTFPPLYHIVRIGREAAKALAAAHSRGLIHRDIKPENVWLEAPDGRLKLLDFGLAKPQQVASKVTATGIIVGTPLYMSPEQARGGELDARTDLFSLGCLLYELVTGETPFGKPTVMATMLALTLETPTPPLERNAFCPPALNDLILRLLAKSVSDRPESAQALVAEFEAIEKGTSPQQSSSGARPASPSMWLRAQVPQPESSVSPAPKSPDVSESLARSGVKKAERRQVTVLHSGCEFFESDQYLEDPQGDAQKQILQAVEDRWRKIVGKLGGTVVECTAEKMIACFGYPVAREDATELAADAALEILESLTTLCNKKKLELGPWLSMHTGPAVVSVEGQNISLAGEARSISSRLKNIARTGQIVISESTNKVLRGKYNCVSLGQYQVKGADNRLEVFELQSVAEGSKALVTSISAELTPLTGRDQEISLLKDRWEKAQDGMGQVVLLIGDAGLGKSRLAHGMKWHVMETAPASGPNGADPPVIEWRCSPRFQNTGLYPAIDFFQRLLQFHRGEAPATQYERLLQHLDRYGLAKKEIVPLFAQLLSLPSDARYPSLALPPAREREALFQALRDWLQAYAAKQPVLFTIEDLHWMDASTLDFLCELQAEGIQDPLLLLLTFRPEFQTPWPALAHQTSLALNRLTKRQVAELMNSKTNAEVSESVIDEVYDRSAGVPLFVEEFTSMLQESGMLSQAGLAPRDAKSLMARAIPTTLHDLIMTRLDRMEGDKDLAQLASALGREFNYRLLLAVSGHDEATLSGELSTLVRAEILQQKGRAPESTYVFKHALFEDALYNSMLTGHRQQCHMRIAEVLESQATDVMQTPPEIIAHHLAESGNIEKAVGYLLTAALKSQEQYANAESISHLTKALHLVSLLPESPTRHQSELSVLIPLATAYQIAMGYAAPDVAPTLSRARELVQKIGNSEQLFEIMWVNWTWHLVRADLDLCLQLAEEMVALAHDVQDKAILMEAYVAPAVTLYYRGDFAGCRTLCQKALNEFEDLDACQSWSIKLGQNSAVVSRCYLALSLWHLGSTDEALQLMEATIALARRVAQPFSLAHALFFASWLYYECNLPDKLAQTAEEELAIANEQAFGLWQATGQFHLGAALLLQGHSKEAVEQMENGVESFKSLAAYLTIPAQLAVLATGYIKCNRLDDARRVLDEAHNHAEGNNDKAYGAELSRLQGVAALAANDKDVAAKYFNTAIEAARQFNSKAWESRALAGSNDWTEDASGGNIRLVP